MRRRASGVDDVQLVDDAGAVPEQVGSVPRSAIAVPPSAPLKWMRYVPPAFETSTLPEADQAQAASAPWIAAGVVREADGRALDDAGGGAAPAPSDEPVSRYEVAVEPVAISTFSPLGVVPR